MNPNVPRTQSFVDGYDFDAYNAVGFGSFSSEKAKGAKIKAPKLGGFKRVWSYLTNVVDLSSKKGDREKTLEAVQRLGGTFVVNGDDIIYRWDDRLPGDTPDLDEVMDVVKGASKL